MMKEYILDHVDELDAQQLFEYINQGIVTLEELKKTENLDGSKRKKIQELQKEGDKVDDAAWEQARYGNEGALRDYITNFPAGKHVVEAKAKIDSIESEKEDNRRKRQEILDKIRLNPNTYSPNQIKDFLNKDMFTAFELENYCNIPKSAIANLDKIKTPRLELGATPDSIPTGFTEVYFWGCPGSGKTCALGAILHMAEQKGYLNIATGPGYNYATQLKNMFSDDDVANDYLPAPSPVDTTQYMPFTLQKPSEKGTRSVSLIELSGEVFKCFYYKIAGLPFPAQTYEDTFNSLQSFLGSKNRKIHFFFIDYDRENKPDDSGLKQSDYLAAASTYFNNNQIFGKTTDAIYIVLTKSDLLLDENNNPVTGYENRVECAKMHLNGQNYKSFINTLKDICKKYDINAQKLTVEPFSLGKVYFKEICNFDGTAAACIVDILMARIPRSKKSILNFFNK